MTFGIGATLARLREQSKVQQQQAPAQAVPPRSAAPKGIAANAQDTIASSSSSAPAQVYPPLPEAAPFQRGSVSAPPTAAPQAGPHSSLAFSSPITQRSSSQPLTTPPRVPVLAPKTPEHVIREADIESGNFKSPAHYHYSEKLANPTPSKIPDRHERDAIKKFARQKVEKRPINSVAMGASPQQDMGRIRGKQYRLLPNGTVAVPTSVPGEERVYGGHLGTDGKTICLFPVKGKDVVNVAGPHLKTVLQNFKQDPLGSPDFAHFLRRSTTPKPQAEDSSSTPPLRDDPSPLPPPLPLPSSSPPIPVGSLRAPPFVVAEVSSILSQPLVTSQNPSQVLRFSDDEEELELQSTRAPRLLPPDASVSSVRRKTDFDSSDDESEAQAMQSPRADRTAKRHHREETSLEHPSPLSLLKVNRHVVRAPIPFPSFLQSPPKDRAAQQQHDADSFSEHPSASSPLKAKRAAPIDPSSLPSLLQSAPRERVAKRKKSEETPAEATSSASFPKPMPAFPSLKDSPRAERALKRHHGPDNSGEAIDIPSVESGSGEDNSPRVATKAVSRYTGGLAQSQAFDQ